MSRPAFRFEETVHGVSIDVLPLPLFSPVRCFMTLFALFWNLFIIVFLFAALGNVFPSGFPQWGHISTIATLLVIPHTLAGIGLALYAVHLARLRIIFDVVGDTLLISKRGLFGVKQRDFDWEFVRKIAAAASGSSQNGRSLLHLEIHCNDGSQHNYLTPHSDACTERVAELLNEHFMQAET